MPVRIAPPAREQWPAVLSTLSNHLRPSGKWPLWSEYPTILSPHNHFRSLVAWEGSRAVSHAAFYPFHVETTRGRLPIAAVGQVWTAPEFQGRGLASQVMTQLEAQMKDMRLQMALLWTGDARLYKKLGYEEAGKELDWVFQSGESDVVLGQVSAALMGEVEKVERVHLMEILHTVIPLHDRHRLSTERNPEEWKAYADIPATQWYVYKEWGKVLAYVVIGKGEDLSGMIHEWGGVPEGVLRIIKELVGKQFPRLVLMCPDDAQEPMVTLLRQHRTPVVEGIVGYAKNLLLDATRFQELIQRERSAFFLWGFDSV